LPFQKLQFRPGLVQDATRYSAEGAWWSGDKVRFRQGFPQKIGGWARAFTDVLYGTCRAVITWMTNTGQQLMGFGTSRRYYVQTGGTLYDITPVGSTATLANPLTSANGSDEIVVADASHGQQDGSTVIISGATGFNGLVTGELNAEHIIQVIDVNSYKIKVATPASGNGAGGGATVTLTYLIFPGADMISYSGGWGTSGWGSGGWGSSYTSTTVTTQVALWTHDNYGEDLFAAVRGGPLYCWQYASGTGLSTRMELATTFSATLPVPPDPAWIPTAVNVIVFSGNSDLLVACGVNQSDTSTDLDPMFVRWSDQSNPYDWEPRDDNQAGGQRLSSGSEIVAAKRSRQELLIWTDTALYSSQYVGPPDVLSLIAVSENISIMGPNAAAVRNGVAYWMGTSKFYVYDGSVRAIPCPILTRVFGNISVPTRYQVFAGIVEEFDEIIWHYCSFDADLPDRYAAFNAATQEWTFGTFDRTAWVYSPFDGLPVAAQPNATTDVWGDTVYESTILFHEVGNDDNSTGTPVGMEAFIESADFDIGEGHQFSFVTHVIPDVRFDGSTGTDPSLTMTLTPRNQPGNAYESEPAESVIRSATLPVEQYTPMLYVRLRGRQMKLRIDSSDLGVQWRLGVPRVSIRPDGRR